MQERNLERLVKIAKILRQVNKYTGIAQIPITILTKTPSGLENYLNSINTNTDEVWKSINQENGSVRHLLFLNEEVKK